MYSHSELANFDYHIPNMIWKNFLFNFSLAYPSIFSLSAMIFQSDKNGIIHWSIFKDILHRICLTQFEDLMWIWTYLVKMNTMSYNQTDSVTFSADLQLLFFGDWTTAREYQSCSCNYPCWWINFFRSMMVTLKCNYCVL